VTADVESLDAEGVILVEQTLHSPLTTAAVSSAAPHRGQRGSDEDIGRIMRQRNQRQLRWISNGPVSVQHGFLMRNLRDGVLERSRVKEALGHAGRSGVPSRSAIPIGRPENAPPLRRALATHDDYRMASTWANRGMHRQCLLGVHGSRGTKSSCQFASSRFRPRRGGRHQGIACETARRARRVLQAAADRAPNAPDAHRRLEAFAQQPVERADATRSRKSRAANVRADFGPRDPWRGDNSCRGVRVHKSTLSSN
jgi:hypothetical protein